STETPSDPPLLLERPLCGLRECISQIRKAAVQGGSEVRAGGDVDELRFSPLAVRELKNQERGVCRLDAPAELVNQGVLVGGAVRCHADERRVALQVERDGSRERACLSCGRIAGGG